MPNSRLTIRGESLPARCEICHQADLFDPVTITCRRCASISIPELLNQSNPPDQDECPWYLSFRPIPPFLVACCVIGFCFREEVISYPDLIWLPVSILTLLSFGLAAAIIIAKLLDVAKRERDRTRWVQSAAGHQFPTVPMNAEIEIPETHLSIQKEHLPIRCETCHQADLFDPVTITCRRCASISINALLNQPDRLPQNAIPINQTATFIPLVLGGGLIVCFVRVAFSDADSLWVLLGILVLLFYGLALTFTISGWLKGAQNRRDRNLRTQSGAAHAFPEFTKNGRDGHV